MLPDTGQNSGIYQAAEAAAWVVLYIVGGILVVTGVINLIKRNREMTENSKTPPAPSPIQPSAGPAVREQDAIYQRGQVVGRVIDPEVDVEAKEIRFSEIYKSDMLLLPDECEFQKFRIMVQRVADATKVDRANTGKGRILRGCVADILGYREQ